MCVDPQWLLARLAMEREGAIMEGSNKSCVSRNFFAYYLESSGRRPWDAWDATFTILSEGYAELEMTPQAIIPRGKTREETAFASVILSFYPLHRWETTTHSAIGPIR